MKFTEDGQPDLRASWKHQIDEVIPRDVIAPAVGGLDTLTESMDHAIDSCDVLRKNPTAPWRPPRRFVKSMRAAIANAKQARDALTAMHRELKRASAQLREE